MWYTGLTYHTIYLVSMQLSTSQGTVSRGGWRRVSSAKGSWLLCTYALAATAATKIKFQLLVDTALGVTTNAGAASRTSPNCCGRRRSEQVWKLGRDGSNQMLDAD
jgi:hypothetical protein